MTHGIDTDFLVAVEITDHPFHRAANAVLDDLLANGHDLALTPQTLAEFIHIATDAKRMPQPLTIAEAIRSAQHWWQAAEVVRIFPNDHAVSNFFVWLSRHQLGRKRLLDTMLAATFRNAGIKKILTNNERDFAILGEFEIITFRK